MSLLCFGVDVAKGRLDALDKVCLSDVRKDKKSGREPQVLTLGCGSGGFESVLVSHRVNVVAVDIVDHAATFSQIREQVGVSEQVCRFVHEDMYQWVMQADLSAVTHVVCQRAVHYLSYEKAAAMLEKLSSIENGTLYISVTGIESAIGEGYTDAIKPVVERLCQLPQKQQELFSITAPVCLYTQEEFRHLIEQSGWIVDSLLTSAFGNHVAVGKTGTLQEEKK